MQRGRSRDRPASAIRPEGPFRFCRGDAMAQVLAVIWFLIVAFVAAGPARADFELPGLSGDAAGYAQSIQAKAPPQATPAQRDDALKQARAARERGDVTVAI